MLLKILVMPRFLLNFIKTMMRESNRIAFAITCLYVIVQFICLQLFGYTPYPDSNGYISLAQECVDAGTFYPQNLTDIPFLWNIGAINAVTISLYLFDSIKPLLILYTLMQGFMVWVVFAIAKELFNNKIALVSLFLFVLYPANYGCGTSVLSEVPFIFFSLLSLLVALRGNFLCGGMLFALANYFRPMSIIFIVVLILFMAYKRVGIRKYFYLLLGFYLITCPIGMVNYATKGRYFTQGAMGWMGLMQYSWDHDRDKKSDYDLFPNNDPNKIEERLNYDCLQRDSVWKSHFFLWLSNNKFEYLRQMPEKVIKTYISDNVNFCVFLPDKNNREYMYDELSMSTLAAVFPNWTHIQKLTIINLVYYYFLLLGGILGCICLVKNKQISSLIIPFITIIAGTGLLMLVGHGEARFHQPFMPMFIMLSAYFFVEIFHRSGIGFRE